MTVAPDATRSRKEPLPSDDSTNLFANEVDYSSRVSVDPSAEAGGDGTSPGTPGKVRSKGIHGHTPQSLISRPSRGATDTQEESSSGVRITRHDVADIFRGSATTGTVNSEQIERIRKMHDSIREGASFSFNYIWLLIVASIVAALGLATDSSTTVISSMLLSPIMGPVLGMSYGLVIWDLSLIKLSAKTELISLLVCIIFGMIVAVLTSWTELSDKWATDEMLSRGTKQTFLVGIPIAFFSGLGVALSLLDDQTSSLVGVAISASLLPPAVNCGMLFIFEVMVHRADRLDLDKGYRFDDENFALMGMWSISLTIVNIVAVWLGAALMFRMKEVLPIKKSVFWTDLKTARRIYQKRAIMVEEEADSGDNTDGPSSPGIFARAVSKFNAQWNTEDITEGVEKGDGANQESSSEEAAATLGTAPVDSMTC